MLLAGKEELVELRWLHVCSREHGMRLAAMMDLVLEKMLQDGGDAGGRRRAIGPRQHQAFAKRGLGLAFAEGEQTAIARALGVVKRRGISKIRWRIAIALEHRRVALERVDIIDIDALKRDPTVLERYSDPPPDFTDAASLYDAQRASDRRLLAFCERQTEASLGEGLVLPRPNRTPPPSSVAS